MYTYGNTRESIWKSVSIYNQQLQQNMDGPANPKNRKSQIRSYMYFSNVKRKHGVIQSIAYRLCLYHGNKSGPMPYYARKVL